LRQNLTMNLIGGRHTHIPYVHNTWHNDMQETGKISFRILDL
jgi:hypothetical protein